MNIANLANQEILLRTLKIIVKSSPKWTAWRLILITFEGLLPLVNIYILKMVVDEIVNSINKNQASEEAVQTVMMIILLWAAINLVSSVIRKLSLYVSTAQQQLLADYLQEIIHKKSSSIDYQFFEDHEYYDNFHRVQKETSGKCNQLITDISSVVKNLISLLGLLVLLLTLHWVVIVILVVTILPSALIRFKYAGKIHQWRKNRTSSYRQAGNFSQILTSANFAKELRIFHWVDGFVQKFQSLRKILFKEKLTIDYIKAKRDIFSSLNEVMALIGVSYFIVNQGISGVITIGSIVMYFQAFQRGQQFLRSSVQSLISIYESRLYLEHLYDFLDLKLKMPECESPRQIPAAIEMLTFEEVSFSYPFGRGEVLKKISCEIFPSQILAIVGRNGSGKSTIAKLLCRLYDPSIGSIKFNGIDIREFKTEEWRGHISTLFQDFAKFNLSLQSNITGKDIEKESQQIFKSLEHAGALDIYNELGGDPFVVLGKIFNDSKELSGGQWQRIALARAFHKETPILILDEPTSHMDGFSEKAFLQKLKELKRNRIIILISYRVSNVKLADHVILLDKGQVIDAGGHEELQERSELYQKLFQTEIQTLGNKGQALYKL